MTSKPLRLSCEQWYLWIDRALCAVAASSGAFALRCTGWFWMRTARVVPVPVVPCSSAMLWRRICGLRHCSFWLIAQSRYNIPPQRQRWYKLRPSRNPQTFLFNWAGLLGHQQRRCAAYHADRGPAAVIMRLPGSVSEYRTWPAGAR